MEFNEKELKYKLDQEEELWLLTCLHQKDEEEINNLFKDKNKINW